MIRADISAASRREFATLLRTLERRTGHVVSDSIIDIGREASRQLAQKVPPFGLNQRTGEKFQKSIAKQVNRAVSNAQVTGAAGDAAKVHAERRDSKGQVPKGLVDRGQLQRAPIEIRDRERHIDKKQAAAGIVKGAWIHAGTQLPRATQVVIGRPRVQVGRWIMRHLSKGQATFRRAGISTEITLTNTVPWVQRVQSNSLVQSAVRAAVKGVTKDIQRRIDQINP